MEGPERRLGSADVCGTEDLLITRCESVIKQHCRGYPLRPSPQTRKGESYMESNTNCSNSLQKMAWWARLWDRRPASGTVEPSPQNSGFKGSWSPGSLGELIYYYHIDNVRFFSHFGEPISPEAFLSGAHSCSPGAVFANWFVCMADSAGSLPTPVSFFSSHPERLSTRQ